MVAEEGFEPTVRLRCPKSAGTTKLLPILTAAPSPPRCICPRQRFGGSPFGNPKLVAKTISVTKKQKTPKRVSFRFWLRRKDLNQRPSGYEPDELTNCSTPRYICLLFHQQELFYHLFLLLSRALGYFFEATVNLCKIHLLIYS